MLGFLLGLVFLGTAGVDFVVNGKSRAASGFVIGLVLVLVCTMQSIRIHRELQAREARHVNEQSPPSTGHRSR